MFGRIMFWRIFGFYPKRDNCVVDTATVTLIADPIDARVVGAILHNMACAVEDRRVAASSLEDVYLSMDQDVLVEVLADMKLLVRVAQKQYEKAENALIQTCKLATRYGFYDAVPTKCQRFVTRPDEEDGNNKYAEIAEPVV